jgi:hypothetical protein
VKTILVIKMKQFEPVAKSTSEYCKEGVLIGIKGRVYGLGG